MKSTFGGLLAAVCLVVVSVRAADDNLIAAVRAADDERVAATIAGDRARLEAIYSDDLSYAHSSGKVDNKAVHVETIAKRTNAYEKFDYRVREFRLAGPGVVLMTGRVIIHSSGAKGKDQNDVNFLAVWREEHGRWRFLAWQACKNPPAETPKE
jgi:ketosteroid isomerase-like protein